MTNPSPTLTPQDIQAEYGFIALLAKSVPEIGTLLQQAVAQQWSTDRFSMAVANTGWWKSTPDTVRDWLVTQISDPATAARQMQDGANTARQLAGTMGFDNISDSDAQNIWLTSQLHQYSDAQENSYISQVLAPKFANVKDIGGTYGNILDNARQMASQYGYQGPSVEGELRQWVNAATNVGDMDPTTALAGWQSKLQHWAEAKYAPFANQIANGMTVQDIAKPYADAYQQVLEQPPSQGIDDPLVQKALQGVAGKDGQPQAQTVWQFQQGLRQDPRWAKTQNAQQSMAQVVTKVGQTFGFIGGSGG